MIAEQTATYEAEYCSNSLLLSGAEKDKKMNAVDLFFNFLEHSPIKFENNAKMHNYIENIKQLNLVQLICQDVVKSFAKSKVMLTLEIANGDYFVDDYLALYVQCLDDDVDAKIDIIMDKYKVSPWNTDGWFLMTSLENKENEQYGI